MFELEKFIEGFIKLELKKRDLSIYRINMITHHVIDGCYAFRLIYGEDNIIKQCYQIDWNSVKFNRDLGLFSIDFGKRYQWSYREILVIDKRLIREFKLNSLI